jgi:hypothetical protein
LTCSTCARNPPSFVEQQDAGFGQLDAACQAAEQRGAHFLLQMADLQAERRLLDAEAFGGAGEVQFLRHGDEIAKMPEFHPRFTAVPRHRWCSGRASCFRVFDVWSYLKDIEIYQSIYWTHVPADANLLTGGRSSVVPSQGAET